MKPICLGKRAGVSARLKILPSPPYHSKLAQTASSRSAFAVTYSSAGERMPFERPRRRVVHTDRLARRSRFIATWARRSNRIPSALKRLSATCFRRLRHSSTRRRVLVSRSSGGASMPHWSLNLSSRVATRSHHDAVASTPVLSGDVPPAARAWCSGPAEMGRWIQEVAFKQHSKPVLSLTSDYGSDNRCSRLEPKCDRWTKRTSDTNRDTTRSNKATTVAAAQTENTTSARRATKFRTMCIQSYTRNDRRQMRWRTHYGVRVR